MNPTPLGTKKRIIFLAAVLLLLIVALAARVGYIQIIKGDEYKAMAREQQTRDEVISAKRGAILDRNGQELAISGTCYTIWARPASFKASEDEEKNAQALKETTEGLSEILGIDPQEVNGLLTKEQTLVKVAKYLDKETADKIREKKLKGVEIAEDVRRYYPMGEFAAHLLGSVTDDSKGLSGIELKYDQYLRGVPGRWIKNTDVTGKDLSYGVDEYYGAEDGMSVVLTLDSVIQHYVEKSIKQVMKDTAAKRVMCIVMDPKTGDVLAMASTPDFDPNNPRVPLDEAEAAYVETLDSEGKMDYWNKMWRNPLISDTYEPGSTFKLITTSIALEERVTNPKEYFTCTGSYNVFGTILHCWRSYNPHGLETLTEAVGNSCNPVFIQLAQRLGEKKYYEYLDLFGFYEKTGIDFPGEGMAILQDRKTAGPVGLATMSYGQGIAVTPIQLITAISAIGNGGKLMQPRLVKALKAADGTVVKEFEPTEIRQVISAQTAEEMGLIMEYVVAEGGGGTAKVEGYRIGGKTGTANKAVAGGYSEDVCASFVGLAPMEDPQVAVLLIVDTPKGLIHGSQTAAPGAALVFRDVLRYLGIKPNYTDAEIAASKTGLVTVPDVVGNNCSEAIGRIGGAYLTSKVIPEDATVEDFIVTDQYPKAGESVKKGSTVYIYK